MKPVHLGIRHLEIMRLSATGYSSVLKKEYEDLARLKTHFSLLDDDNDEVDLVEPRYYGKVPNWVDLLVGITIVCLLLYLVWRG